MEYVVGLMQGGWVIHCYFEGNYIGNVTDSTGNTSKVESLAFFEDSKAESFIEQHLT